MTKDVWDALKLKIDGMSSITSSFNYETGKPDGYPFAVVTATSGSSEFGDSTGSDSGRNLQTHIFTIRIYQEREKQLFGSEKAERVMVEATDELLTALYLDTTLSGTVKWQRPLDWEYGYDDREFLSRFVAVNVEAVEVVAAK